MTVIAWDGRTLAADRRMTSGWSVVGQVTKIFKCGDVLLALSGNYSHALAIKGWYLGGAERASFPPHTGDCAGRLLVIHRSGRICEYDGTPDQQEYYALYNGVATGSGSNEALVAMYCGKTAREAVEIAGLFDVSCGNGIDTLTFEDD